MGLQGHDGLEEQGGEEGQRHGGGQAQLHRGPGLAVGRRRLSATVPRGPGK